LLRGGENQEVSTANGSISAAAERMRLYRARRRYGLRCVTIELRKNEICALIRRGLLQPEARSRPADIVKALYAFFDCTLSR
jgi:hypothetical protein